MMYFRKVLGAGMICLVSLAAGAGQKGITVHNLADDFIAFYDATDGQAAEARRAAFKEQLVPAFPKFYRPSKEGDEAGFDTQIDRAIAGFPALRAKYEAKVRQFGGEIERNIKTFKAHFPDFSPDFDVYFIHSLGQMDGGTRDIDGDYTFIFGADLMAKYHDFESEAAFFQHELFHVYHNEFAPEASCKALWCGIWSEGLAVYASEVLNPDATAAEKLLAIPADLVSGTEARLRFALEDLRAALGSEDEKDYGRFLSFAEDGTGLPKRRGYYLGLLIARELAKDHSLTTMAHMSFAEVEPHIKAALDSLIAAAE